MRLSEMLTAILLTGCVSTTPPPGPAPTTAPAASQPMPPAPQTSSPGAAGDRGPGLLADGAPCFDPDTCASGVCEGQGCTSDKPGTCAPKMRRCTRDLRDYCGCDGVTFQSSGSCPGHRYASPGSCTKVAP